MIRKTSNRFLLLITLLFAALSVLQAATSAHASQYEVPPLTGPYKLAPVKLEASTCESIAITDSHLSREHRLYLYALSPEQMQVFTQRRKTLLEEFAKQLRPHIDRMGGFETRRQCLLENKSRALKYATDAAVEITKVLVEGAEILTKPADIPTITEGLTRHDVGILVFKDMLEVVDRKIVEHARDITDCQQFGICTGIGMKAAIGYGRMFVGLGAFFSRDTVRSFEKDAKWKTTYNIDAEVASRAVTPTISLFLGLRAFLHFDKAASADIGNFKTTYYIGAPIAVTGAKTAGAGAVLGFNGIPVISHFAWFESQMVRVKPTVQGLKDACEAILTVFKDKFAPEKPAVRPGDRTVPDDVQ